MWRWFWVVCVVACSHRIVHQHDVDAGADAADDASIDADPAVVCPAPPPPPVIANCPMAGFGLPNALVGYAHVMSRLADVNGDGKLDLISPQVDFGGVAVALGLGDGTFGVQTAYQAGSQTVSIDVGDLDLDGDIDIVAVSQADNYVYVLPNQGDGTFGGATSLPMNAPRRVLIAQLDGTGRPDLVVVSFTNKNMTTMLATSTGFADPVEYPLTLSPYTAAVGVIDGSGPVDIVAVGYGGGPVLLRNNGSGAFTVMSTVAGDANDVAIADFNRDGKNDVAIASTAGVTIYAGTGTSMLGSSTSIPFRAATGVTAADLDKDGDPDLAVSGWAGYGVIISGPSGYASTIYPLELPSQGAESVTSGDVDGDGNLDLVLSSYTNRNNGVLVLKNPGQGVFPMPTLVALGGSWVFASGDLDGDGKTDVVRPSSAGLEVYLQRSGSLARTATTLPVVGASGAAIADVDVDGIADVVVATSTSAVVFRGLGGGAFAPGVSYATSSDAFEVRVADLGGNCAPEIVLTHQLSPIPGVPAIGVLRNHGNGTFYPEVTYPIENLVSSTLGDFNEDGNVDIVAASASGSTGNLVHMLRGAGDTTLHEVSSVAVPYPWTVLSGDLDGDGHRDLIVATGSSSFALLIRHGLGNGLFGPDIYVPSLYLYTSNSVHALDVNGDGRLDVVVTNDVGLGVHVGLANGTLSPLHAFPMPGLTRLVADVDGDGHIDALVVRDAQDQMPVKLYKVSGSCAP